MNKRFKHRIGSDFQIWSWNVRGLGDFSVADSKARQVSQFFNEQTYWDVVMLQEHKLEADKIPHVERIFLQDGHTWWDHPRDTKVGSLSLCPENGRAR